MPIGTPIKVATVGDIPAGSGKTVDAGGKKIALFNVGGKFHAIDDACKHRGGPLGQGELTGTSVTCPLHGWEYDVTTGKNLDDESIRLGCYPVRVEGEGVLIET